MGISASQATGCPAPTWDSMCADQTTMEHTLEDKRRDALRRQTWRVKNGVITPESTRDELIYFAGRRHAELTLEGDADDVSPFAELKVLQDALKDFMSAAGCEQPGSTTTR